MKRYQAFLTSVYVAVACWLALGPSSSKAAMILNMTDYCEDDIQIEDSGGRGFVLRSQPETNYANNLGCTVTIKTSDPENHVLIHFESFDLVDNDDDPDCSADYLIIDYSSNALCGSSLPSDYLAEKEIELKLVTDSDTVATGFQILVAEVNRDGECDESIDYHCSINDHCIDQELGNEDDVEDYCGNEEFIEVKDEGGKEKDPLEPLWISLRVLGGLTGVLVISIVYGCKRYRYGGMKRCGRQCGNAGVIPAATTTQTPQQPQQIPPPQQMPPPPYSEHASYEMAPPVNPNPEKVPADNMPLDNGTVPAAFNYQTPTSNNYSTPNSYNTSYSYNAR